MKWMIFSVVIPVIMIHVMYYIPVLIWRWLKRRKAGRDRSADLFRLLDNNHVIVIVKSREGYRVAASRGSVAIDGGYSWIVTTGDPRDVFGDLADIAFNLRPPRSEKCR